MKVYFAIPAYRGINSVPFIDALQATIELFESKGHKTNTSILSGCCYIQVARNELVKQFRDTDCDTLFFLDDDMEWDPADALKLAEMPDEVVAGIYRYKTDAEDYPVVINVDENNRARTRADGCISAAFVPTGFLRIKRSAIDRICSSYNSQKYFKRVNGKVVDGYYDLFPQGLRDGQWVGEDYAFCRLWTDIGGQIWVVPNLTLTHHSAKQSFTGNYHQFLLKQPGGSAAKWDLARADAIPGWLSMGEMEWLAEQASQRSCIVEVGSHLGRSTRALADNTQGQVIAVDDWQGPRDVEMSEEEREGLIEQFGSNTRDLIDAGRVIPLVADHRTPVTLPADPDMVFIDGDHSYEAVAADIALWKEKLQPGGLLCGHDYDWDSVKKAVSELVPNAVSVPGTTIWRAA